MAQNTVYIVDPKQYDLFNKAEAFGTPVVLNERVVDVFNVDKLVRDFKDKLRDSQRHDLLLLCGNLPLNVVASSVMLHLHGQVNLLLYDLRLKSYKTRTYTKDDLQEA